MGAQRTSSKRRISPAFLKNACLKKHRFLEKLHLYTAASMGTFLLKNTHFARNACRKSCDRREKIIAEFAKRGSSQIFAAFLKAAEERWTKKTQDGAILQETHVGNRAIAVKKSSLNSQSAVHRRSLPPFSKLRRKDGSKKPKMEARWPKLFWRPLGSQVSSEVEFATEI